MPEDFDVELIPTEGYKQLFPVHRRRAAMFSLAGLGLLNANRAIDTMTGELRTAVLDLVDVLDEAMREGDLPTAHGAAHEIRGLAGTAGLDATGRIANSLCLYLDGMRDGNAKSDDAIVTLHMGAIVRSARASDDDDTKRHSNTVAEQLAALVDRKLAEIKDSVKA